MYIARTHTHKSSGNPILNGSVSSRQQASASAATFPALPNKRGRHKYNPNQSINSVCIPGKRSRNVLVSLSRQLFIVTLELISQTRSCSSAKLLCASAIFKHLALMASVVFERNWARNIHIKDQKDTRSKDNNVCAQYTRSRAAAKSVNTAPIRRGQRDA